MRLAAARLAPACATILLGLATSTSVAYAAAPSSDFYGVNAQAVFSLPPDQWDAQLTAMRDAGITVVRRDASWDQAEPEPPDPATGTHRYDWDAFDQQVAALAQHGLRWYPIIDYSAPWAASVPGNPFSPPTRISDYVAYARALAQRYGRGGVFWREHPALPAYPVTSYEVWNEPNFVRFWQPQAGAADRYADLYLATRAALHQVDPLADVVIGGLVDWDGQAFLRTMYRDRPQLRGHVDAVGYHPYHLTAGRVEDSIRQLRQSLDRLGQERVPIEVTEVGLVAADPYAESLRARLLGTLARDLPDAGVGVTRLIPHTWISLGDEQWGIANPDGTPRPSEVAYAQAIREARALGPLGGTARLSVQSRPLTIDRHGRARLRLVCRGGSGGCRGIVELQARVRTRRGRKARTVGRVRFAVPRGRAARVRVSLTKSARRLLRRNRILRVGVYISPARTQPHPVLRLVAMRGGKRKRVR